MRKIGEYLLGSFIGSSLFFLAVIAFHAIAGQSNLWSPTTGTVSGLQLTNNYNSALDSLNTCNSGTTAPTNQLNGLPGAGTPSLANCWVDTSTAGFPQIKFYDGTNWLLTGVVDTTNHVYMQPAAGGNLGTITITAAATTDLCQAPKYQGALVLLTGVATIGSFGSSCPQGTIKYVIFNGGQSLTNSGSLSLIGAANFTPGSGDFLTFGTDGVGNWFQEGYSSRAGVNCPSGVTAGTVVVVQGQVQHC